ncbi:hypothetical protein [Stappia sp. ES.058]|uniref:hypothetical protein n=1 Tax=Stappia sp. ES.058 TaxID=1881061 RepID=UPI00087A1896|nr:hypothetical protein [Stappia sp. ES.058]SDT96831.1 hypothetical protein SAMN05428979_0793 [Stappia sp. ES.058]
MPAYRSPAEAEIREAVVARLREIRPQSRIIHEINVKQSGCRADVIAVGLEEIVAVEIKSERDKLDRLPDQMAAMKSVAHHCLVALHEKFLVEQETNVHAAHYERDGTYYLKILPTDPVRLNHGNAWVYSLRARALRPNYDYLGSWDLPVQHHMVALPCAALDMLWRAELATLCVAQRLSTGRRSTRSSMMQDLRWMCSGKELTRGICAALRARECIEGDPPIREEGRAA